MAFTRAVRHAQRLRLAICGPSGCGKTETSLRLAEGLGGKVALIDTEHGSAALYGDRHVFDTLQLGAPYSPARYVEALHEAEQAGYDVAIIDSLSHAWMAEGGCLDQADRAGAKGNKFTAWASITPQHNALVMAMLGSPAHVIVTMRTKSEYVLEPDARGKMVPRKVGTTPVQRDGLEYEFTVVLDQDLEHMVRSSKDRTGVVAGRSFAPTADLGRELLAWLRGQPVEAAPRAPAAEPAPAPATATPTSTDTVTVTVTVGDLYREYVAAAGSKDAAISEMRRITGKASSKEYTDADLAKLREDLKARRQ